MARSHAGLGSRRRTGLSILFAVLMAVFLAGCGGGGSADGDGAQVEQKLKEQLGDLAFTEVTCPDSPKLEKGATFECQAESSNGAQTKIGVAQPEAAGQMKFNIAKNELIQVSAAADYLKQRLSQGGTSAVVDCGSKERLAVDEGTTLVCRATPAGKPAVNYTIVAHPTADDVGITIK